MSAKHFSAVIGWPRAIAYAIAAVVAGVVVGELVAMLIFSGSAVRRLDEQAAHGADSRPAVVAASADLQQARQARSALDDAVVTASRRRDEALVVARCEYNPSQDCPQTHITGIPGAGPENRTANDFLADTQRQLDQAVLDRDRLAPSLDAAVNADQDKLAQARDAAIAGADRGFGARWLAMNGYTLEHAGATVLRALLSGLFVVLFLLPLILRLSRAKTTEDRRTVAHAHRERAELDADTAIAVKQAEVRAAIETMRAEQQLASARMEIEAQNEIDREAQRRRVAAAVAEPPAGDLAAPTPVASERVTEATEQENLPALAESGGAVHTVEKPSLLPSVSGVTRTAARWVRPFVPPIVASAIDTTTRPLRAAREVFEETEEIHLSLRRSHRVSVTSEQTVEEPDERVDVPLAPRVDHTVVARVERPKRDARGQVRAGGGRRELPSAGQSPAD